MDIPVFDLQTKFLMTLQILVQLPGYGHGPVLAAGTAHSHYQLVLPLQNIIGNQKFQHVRQLVDKLPGCPALVDICLNLGLLPCMVAQQS